MLQKVEWGDRPDGGADRRAFRNAVLLALAVLLMLLIPFGAQAVTPPRPDSDARIPAVFARWPRPLDQAPDKAAGGPVVGLHRLPVIPGGFSDRAGTQSTSALQAVFTGSRSVRDYFDEVSSGQFDVLGEVAPWRRAPHTADYYAGTDNGLDLWAAPNNAGRFVYDVIALADQAGLDWGPFDNDGPDGIPNSGDDDGVVDCAIVLHAGPGGECGGNSHLWSHQYFLAGWGYGAYTTQTARHGGGFLTVDDYVLVPELSCDTGAIEIGVICHEYGHALGLPDLYDTETGRAGIGGWGLMGTGSWGGDGNQPTSPSWPSAWTRRDLGWCAVTTIVQDQSVTLPAVSSEDRILAVRDEAMPAGEVFLVENRLRSGYDQSLPGEGLLVWHIDGDVVSATRSLNQVNAGAVFGVSLEQADGAGHLDLTSGGNRGDGGDPWPGTGGAIRFAAGTLPDSDTNASVRTDVVLRAILAPRDPVGLFVEIGVTDLDVTPPAVDLVVPSGGEDWTLGDVVTVAWAASDPSGVAGVELRLSHDGGFTFPAVVVNGLPNTGSWTGSLGNVPGEAVVLQVLAFDAEGNVGIDTSLPFGLSDRYPPGVALSGGPLAGALLDPGDVVNVSWITADNVGVAAVDLELSCDGGATWSPTGIVGQPSTGGAVWTVPDLSCGLARLRAAARDAAGNVGGDMSAVFAINGSTTGIPDLTHLVLGPCIPNPFNPRAEIVFSLPHAGPTRLSVHDAAGRRLRSLLSEYRPAGRQSVIWNGRDDGGRGVASGVYWVRAEGPGGAAILKVTLVR